jgi:chemotaxis protein methyltransferase CheR
VAPFAGDRLGAPALDPSDFDALRRVIHEHSGIWLADAKLVFLQVRLADRLRDASISTPREYYHFIKYDPRGADEILHLVDAITINETWFFREMGPLEAWREAVLERLVESGARLRVWCAGCSNGAEPYTIAMMLGDSLSPTLLSRLEIIATDISQRSLETARAGVYDAHSLRHTEDRWKQKYFEPLGDGRLSIRSELRQYVHFGWSNLTDPHLAARIGPVDLVTCRNVIIYFDERSRQAALANLHAALKNGGYLILGHAESLALVNSPFEVVSISGTVLYRRGSPTRLTP